MWCLCAQLFMDQTEKIFDYFFCIWKWFLALFVFMFCAYFVFHCFKHVLCWKTSVRVFCDLLVAKLEKCIFLHFLRLTRDSWKSSQLILWLASHEIRKLRVYLEALVTHENFCDPSHDLPIAKCPEISFLFLRAFHGKPILNLSHPFLNPSFNTLHQNPINLNGFSFH